MTARRDLVGLVAALAVSTATLAHANPATLVAASSGTAAPARIALLPPPSTDPALAATEAGDANLASEAKRSGVTFAFSIGGGLMIGFGLQDSVGRGGTGSFRLGRVATPRTVVTFELQITAVLHKLATASDVASNSETNLVVGAQHYVNPSFWVRGAVGAGGYNASQVQLSNGQIGSQTIIGPAALFGLGLDLARFKSVVLGLEFTTSMMISGSGVLITSGSDLSLAFD